jgi:thiol-disulfide isomerase/thioredoxin
MGPLASNLFSLFLAAPQVEVGAKAPSLETTGIGNSELCSLDPLRGRVVLYQFFAFWYGPCREVVPHLDRLADSLGPKGFVVVGVTDEGPDPTEKFMLQTGAKWIVAYVSKKTFEAWGVRDVPRAFLVEPGGKVAWGGHPAELSEGDVARHLSRVRYAPDLDRSFPSIESMLRRGNRGEAYAAVRAALDGPAADEKARQGLEKTRAALEEEASCAFSRARRLEEEGDAFGAARAYEALAAEFPSSPAGTEGAAAAARIRGDASLATELAAGREVFEGLALLERGAYREAWARFAAVRASYPEMAAAKRAQALQDRIKEAGKYGFDPDCRKCRRKGEACDDCRSAAQW